jgi:hypothetical protein
MDLSELKGDMDRGFEAVGQQFEGVDRRFEAIDPRFNAVDRRFKETLAFIAAEEEKTRRYMLEESDETRRYMLEESDKTRRHMLEETERTRRHFDVVVEHVKSERNLALDKAIAADARAGRLTATNAADHVDFASRLENHEIRLTRLERKEP